MKRTNRKIVSIATASINIATAYNKNPDADYVAVGHDDLDAVIDYFQDHAVYEYNTNLIMDGQLKFKGKPVIAYIGRPTGYCDTDNPKMTAEQIKQMLDKIYGAGSFSNSGYKFRNGAKNV
jgi:hypothetical protein